jgi:hypothetical protein
VVTFVGSLAGIALGILFSRRAIVGLVTLIMGCSTARWYLICPAMQVGQNWQSHLVVAILAAVVAGCVLLFNLVVPLVRYFLAAGKRK